MALSFVPLQVHDFWLALPAQAVQEILGRRPWVPISGAAPELPGVLAWRGRAVAVLDLGRLVERGTPIAVGEGRHRTLVVQHDDCTLALPVDGVREVQEVPDERVRPAQATRQRFADREIDVDGTPLPLLDLGAILAALAPPGSDG